MAKLVSSLALAVVLGAMAIAALSSVVTVSPSNPGDWTWMVNQNSAKCYFTRGGPPAAEGNPYPMGNGGFYAQLSYAGSDGSQTDNFMLGLDMHNGTPLAGITASQITKLQYTAYLAGPWALRDNDGKRRSPKQPPMLTLTFEDNNQNRRQLWFRPYGPQGIGEYNDRMKWMTYDCINMTSSPESPYFVPVWYDYWTRQTYTTWAEVMAAVPGPTWKLVPTSTTWEPNWDTRTSTQWKHPNWPVAYYVSGGNTVTMEECRTTGTGKCINFWAGARKATCFNRFGQTGSYAWWWESCGFHGCVDSFTLGIDYGAPGPPDVVETTYDFESDGPAPRVVATTMASRWVPTGTGMPAKYAPQFGNQDKYLHKFFGMVTSNPVLDPTSWFQYMFYIWDGSYVTAKGITLPATMQVRYPLNVIPDVQAGEYVSVVGYLHDQFYSSTEPPSELTTNATNLQNYIWP